MVSVGVKTGVGVGGLITITFLVYLLGLSSPDFFVNVDLLYNTPQCFNCEQIYNASSNVSGVVCTVDWREIGGNQAW